MTPDGEVEFSATSNTLSRVPAFQDRLTLGGARLADALFKVHADADYYRAGRIVPGEEIGAPEPAGEMPLRRGALFRRLIGRTE